jgi:hypothetical protein
MKGTLIKDHDEYMLINDERFVIATTDESMLEVTDKMKLSKQNCDEVFGVVDVEKLAENHPLEVSNASHGFGIKDGIVYGFNKAMELNKDKVFTLEDMGNLWDFCVYNKGTFAEFTQPILQPIEIEVEIEMKKVVDKTKVVFSVKGVKGSGDKITTYRYIPSFDTKKCLMLKKI